MLLWSKKSHIWKLAGHILCKFVAWWTDRIPIYCWIEVWFDGTWCCSAPEFSQCIFGKWIWSRKWFLEISLEDRFWASHHKVLEWVLNFWREGDLEIMMTLILSGFNFILHLAHYLVNFRRPLRKSSFANCTLLLAVHRAVSSANWDFEFCLWWGFGTSLTYIEKSNKLRTEHCGNPTMGLGMRHFSFKVQNLPIFRVLNLSKENFNRLALWYLSCTIRRAKFEKELKQSVH